MNTIERIEARFRSGNSVPVERASITSDEWSAIKAVVEAASHVNEHGIAGDWRKLGAALSKLEN